MTSPSEFTQLPAEAANEWVSRVLVCGYRGVDFPFRLRLLGWIQALTGFKRIVVGIGHGAKIAVDSRDLIQRQLLYSGVYEPEVAALIEREISSGDQFVDIGANVGCFSMLAHALGASVIAFEPDPISAAVWRLNCRLNNGASRMQLVESGLSDSAARLRFHRTSIANVGRSGFLAEGDAVESFDVQVDALDKLAPGLGIRAGAVWKIDVEGFEHAVLAGAHASLREYPPRLIIFETSNSEKSHRIFSLLDTHGYHVEHLQRRSGEREANENYVARRRLSL